MCSVCRTDGACFCEQAEADDLEARIAEARELVSTGRKLVAALEERLSALLELAGEDAGRLRLFDPEPEPRPA